jgi:formylglycine-generating enzyme required for sulfatase activity
MMLSLLTVGWLVLAQSPEAEMVPIPAGEFWMGCYDKTDKQCQPDEKPGRLTYLDAFLIDRTEVTVEQYKKCVDAGRCRPPKTGEYFNWGVAGREQHPVNGVAWDDAGTYCVWAEKRLPSEAEWEKAARGTDGRAYPWGQEKATCELAVIDELKKGGIGCGKKSTWPVCSKPKGNSPYGLCDTIGNVWEWVEDWYQETYYQQAPAKNPKGPEAGKDRARRGGCWYYGSHGNLLGIKGTLRVSNRFHLNPVIQHYNQGFRCAKDAQGSTPAAQDPASTQATPKAPAAPKDTPSAPKDAPKAKK